MSVSALSSSLPPSSLPTVSPRILTQNKLDQLFGEIKFYEQIWNGLNLSSNIFMLATSSIVVLAPQATLGTFTAIGAVTSAALKLLCERKEQALNKQMNVLEEEEFSAELAEINLKFSISQDLTNQIANIKTKESAFKQIPVEKISTKAEVVAKERESLAKKQEWHEAIKNAIVTTMQAIASIDDHPCELPRDIALNLAEVLANYGISIYADQMAPHPFESSLNVLRVALAMQEYGLGLSQKAPDLSKVTSLNDLYATDFAVAQGTDLTKLEMLSANWAQATANLNQSQLIHAVLLLRYTNGALRYLNQTDLALSEKLLTTAESCLEAARNNPKYDRKEIEDQLAELKYNEMTGFIASKAQQASPEEAIQLQAKLALLWDECIALSKNPEKMRARCDNKRTFVMDMLPEAAIEHRQRALDRHLALPESQQEINLIALCWNNLAHAYKAVQNYPEALRCARKANEAAIQSRMKGIIDTQFENISENCVEISKLMLKKINDDLEAQTVVKAST